MSNRRYTKQEDNMIFKFVDEHGLDADITELAERLGRSKLSVSYRIKNLRIHSQVGDLSKEENKRLLEKVKPYVDAAKNVPWKDISEMYFYNPKRSPELLRRKYKLLKLKQIHGSEDSDSQESSSASTSDTESEDEQPKPELNFLSSTESEDDVQEIVPAERSSPIRATASRSPPRPSSPRPLGQTLSTQGAFGSPWVTGPRITVWDNNEKNQTMFTLNVNKSSVTSKIPSFYYVINKNVTKPHIMVVLPENDQ